MHRIFIGSNRIRCLAGLLVVLSAGVTLNIFSQDSVSTSRAEFRFPAGDQNNKRSSGKSAHWTIGGCRSAPPRDR